MFNFSFRTFAGSKSVFFFLLTYADENGVEQPYDAESCDPVFVLSPIGTDSNIEKGIGYGLTVVDAETGKISITVNPEDTSELTETTDIRCSVWVLDEDGDRVLAGNGALRVVAVSPVLSGS